MPREGGEVRNGLLPVGAGPQEVELMAAQRFLVRVAGVLTELSSLDGVLNATSRRNPGESFLIDAREPVSVKSTDSSSSLRWEGIRARGAGARATGEDGKWGTFFRVNGAVSC